MKKTFSLGTLLGLLLVFFVLLSIFISGGLYYFNFHTKEIEREKNLMLLTNVSLADNLNGKLIDKIHIIRTLASSRELVQLLKRSNLAYENQTAAQRAHSIESENAAWMKSVSLTDPVVSLRLNSPTADILNRLMKQNPGVYGEIFVTNNYGVVTGATGKLTTLAHAHKYWWRGAFADGKGKVFIDDRGYDESVKGVVLGLALPVWGRDGIVGIIKANLNVIPLMSSIVGSSKEIRQYMVGVYRSGGLLILDDNHEPFSTLAEEGVVDILQARSPLSITIENEEGAHFHTAVPIAITLGDGDIIFGGNPQSIDQKMGNRGEFWVVVLTRPGPVLNINSPEFQTFLVFIMLFVGLALTVGLWAVRRLLGPLDTLTNEISTYDIDKPFQQLDGFLTKEVNILASAFSNLGERLQATMVSRDEVQKKERSLSMAQQIAHIGSWELDHVSNELSWSEEVYRIFEIAPKEFGGSYEAFLELVHPDDRKLVNRAYSDSVQTKGPYSIEHRLLMKDGRIKFVNERCETTFDENGHPLSSIGTVQDISKRKRDNENLKETQILIEQQQKMLSEVGRISKTGGWKIDVATMNLEWSDETYRIHEVPDDFELDVDGAINFYTPESRPIITAAVESSLKDGRPFDLELTMTTAQGRPLWVRALCEPVFKEGELVSLVGTFQDITDRKNIEETLLKANTALKTISMANEALVHATTKKQLLNDVCRIVVEEGGYHMAWIGFTEDDPEKSIRPVAHFGHERGYLKAIKPSWSDATERGNCPAGIACRNGKPRVVSDIENDPEFKPFREISLERDYRSVVSLPLLFEGESFGVFCIFANRVNAFTEDNLPLLMELAHDLAFGLRALEDKKEQERTEELLRWDVAVDTALAEISRTILEKDISIEDISYQILEQVRKLTQSQFGFVGYIDPDTGFLVCPTFTRDIWDQCDVENKSAVFEKFVGLMGWPLNNKKAILTNDPARDPRSTGVPPGHLPIEKFLAVPALIGDELLGEIAIANPKGDYGDRDLFLLERVANFYALALHRMRAAERIKESERQIRLLMDSTGEGIYAIDQDGNCTICNPAALAMLGYENVDDVLGKNTHALFHHTRADGSEYPIEECPLNQTIGDGRVIEAEDEIFWRADGSSFRVSFKSHPVMQDGVLTGAVVSFTDITERLETEQQLWQSQKVESIGNLAGGIAHDINNLLLPIQALTDMTLEELPQDSSHFKRLSKVLDASVEAKNLIAQILTFSRKEEPRMERIDLAETLRTVMDLLRSTVPTSLKIKTQIKDVGDIMADSSQIHAVLMNLASNSADAMSGNVGNLLISLSRRNATKTDAALPSIEAGKPYAVLRVKDDGEGIDEKTVQRLFDPFFTTKKPGEGTGLGLSIVHGIITKHGGAIKVNSKVGKGTTFEIFLPIVDSANE